MNKLATGDELTLDAMRRDFKRLSRIAEKAKAVCDECMSIGSEFISIHDEFIEIVKSKDHGTATIKKLDSLKKRSDKADKIIKKDLLKLMDNQSEAQITRDRLGQEIQMLEFGNDLRKNNF